MHPLVNIAVRAARAAGKIIAHSFERVEDIEVQVKSRNNFVTEVDKLAEEEIIRTIRQTYPEHAILGEESGHLAGTDDEITWIIDPLDGTTNFIHGYPQFAVSIGILQRGRIDHGIIYDPIRDELFTASRGRGAQMNSRRLRVSKQVSLEGALVSFAVSASRHDLVSAFIKSLSTQESSISGVRYSGSAVLDLAYVASGRLDGCWQVNLQPWDLAAGSIIITEAGGLISDFTGGNDILEKCEIVAGNPKLFKSLLQIAGSIKNNSAPA